MSKYTTNEEESQCLPNRLGLTRPGEIAEAEFEGFLLAEIMLTETLTTATRFDCQYIRNIHKLALKELYTFAGRYRTVNMSKEDSSSLLLCLYHRACNFLKMKF